MFYFFMAVQRDEEVQKKGVVIIYYGIGQSRMVEGRTSRTWKMWWGLPLRLIGYHYCIDSSVMNPAYGILSKMMDNDPLCRFRFHTGK